MWMWWLHSHISLLHFCMSRRQKLTLWSDKIRKGRDGGNGVGTGHFEAISFFFFFIFFSTCNIISHFISQRFFLSFYRFALLYLSPGSFHLMICRTHIVYSVLDWTLLEKNTPVSTDLMQERECEILLWNPAAQGC